MKDARMTIRLPASELAFAKDYAKEHGLTLTGLIHHYFELLKRSEEEKVPDEVFEIAGKLSPDMDARDDYHSGMLRKHS